ncbi:hypothetical protein CLUG_00999 [Clavispora lusitaniae ATCC 42720]|uniref:Uncharacterized protein n=1 Tax=Clavispora lusitaniae (strain ATCC 42720) TaxID=306902 RepID=C4XYH6_CLAL4|nr:uncharacterized protein CLUG_00999 [Clavispora lusitaniae ATCC 42720]EEQ36876.1 hypothetical protein CLUG_00999 [Clavispora lusitaniae ATCC 42720]
MKLMVMSLVFVQNFVSPLWQHEGSLVHLGIVVFQVLVDKFVVPLESQWLLDISGLVLATNHESNSTGGVSWNRGVSVFSHRENSLAVLLQFGDDVHVQPDTFCSGGDNTLLSQSTLQQLKVRLLEERLCWTFRVRRVGNDHVKSVLVVLQKLKTVTNVHLGSWVVVSFCHVWQVLLGNLNDSLVNVTQPSFLDRGVLQDFSQNTSVSTSNNQSLLWVWVRVHGQVSDHLSVRVFISLCNSNTVVQNQDIAPVCGLENQNISVLGLTSIQNLLNFQGHGRSRPHGV